MEYSIFRTKSLMTISADKNFAVSHFASVCLYCLQNINRHGEWNIDRTRTTPKSGHFLAQFCPNLPERHSRIRNASSVKSSNEGTPLTELSDPWLFHAELLARCIHLAHDSLRNLGFWQRLHSARSAEGDWNCIGFVRLVPVFAVFDYFDCNSINCCYKATLVVWSLPAPQR